MNIDKRPPLRVRQGPRLANRLAHAVVTTAGVALLVAGLLFDAFVYFSLRSAMVDDLVVQARIAAENCSAAIIFQDARAAAETLAGLQASPAILHAELRDDQGRVLARYRAAGTRGDGHEAAPTIEGGVGHAFVRNRLFVSQPVREADRTVGSVHLAASLNPLYQRVATYVGITVLTSALAFGLAFLLVIRLRRDVDATESRLDYLAYYDPVTGLANRHAANEQIERLIQAGGRGSEGFALLLLDLDDFKVVNDTLGHAVGDQLLRALAERLTASMRATDRVFRFGGDEFVMLAPRVGGRLQLQLLGQAAMLALEAPVTLGSHELRVRGSVGLAQFPADASDAAGLIRAADTAMYEAKRQGKNTSAIFHADLERGARARMRLDADLRRAIERNELRLCYQPIVDLRQQRMVGVEALLRWDHPELGTVSPVDFIALAERSGVIVDIGQWVLHTACRQMKAWADAGHAELHVAVNVSAVQLRRGLKRQVDAALAASLADPRCLEIEITEHSMVEDIASNVAQLAALGERGIRVAVDDFGTGLSSLAYLKRLPINKLKIDRAFVKDLPHSSDDAAIALAIISMARSLGLTVVAEGVETEAQRSFLLAQGCECAQGFLFSRPVDPAVISELLQRHACPGPVWPGAGRVPLRLA
ncbi:putative bifunctional diguanylate cyclase/phosphodiesterase [Piscinibacter sp.]|jgi:diguanylate cyclase (GGDEF)-like protein|uniref:putative bifunctional diguanylate cyclase/phosphodiesterase n=1 Tax=Piscinibacter sp. TaxID=1903157 RepID=UPI002F424CA2